MKRQAFSILVFGSALLYAASAFAQPSDVDEFGPVHDQAKFESHQSMAFEFRIGPYLPNVDDEFNGADTPFEDHFDDKRRWHLGFEVDWQLLRIPRFGTLGPGVGLGLTSLEGAAFTDDNETADQTTTLTIMPMHAVAVARVDVLARETAVPVVPYAKLGLGYALWWTDNGNGLERVDGRRGADTSYGLVWALGGMLMLDAFDEVAAADLDATAGVNHSYVYLEWFNSDLDGFNSGKLQAGVNTWMTGIAVEM